MFKFICFVYLPILVLGIGWSSHYNKDENIDIGNGQTSQHIEVSIDPQRNKASIDSEDTKARPKRMVNAPDQTTFDMKDFGYHAGLIINNINICGAAIYNETVVITAAHCTFNYTASQIEIHVGSKNFSSPNQSVLAKRKVEHENFDSKKFHNNICILFLQTPLEMTGEVGKVNLPMIDTNYSIGSNGNISGWGKTHEDNDDISDILHIGSIPITDDDHCINIFASYDKSISICVGDMTVEDPVDACFGDSGGPFVINGTLVGIISHGLSISCGSKGIPSVLTKVSYHLPWIEEVLGKEPLDDSNTYSMILGVCGVIFVIIILITIYFYRITINLSRSNGSDAKEGIPLNR